MNNARRKRLDTIRTELYAIREKLAALSEEESEAFENTPPALQTENAELSEGLIVDALGELQDCLNTLEDPELGLDA